MIDMKRIAFLALFLVACGEPFEAPLFTGTATGGEAGSAGSNAGSSAGGAAGLDAGEDSTSADAAPCGPLMVQYGGVCVDSRPALLADGAQGPAVSWEQAQEICAGRGARLCSEDEREGGCPDGQMSLDTPANSIYCGGPAATWEWSSSAACADGRCVSPCCNSVSNPCQCNSAVEFLSFRCCRDLD